MDQQEMHKKLQQLEKDYDHLWGLYSEMSTYQDKKHESDDKYLLIRIDNLRKTIIELSEHCAKKSLKRLLLAIAIFSMILICIMSASANGLKDFLHLIPLSVVFSVTLLFVSYCISSFTFVKTKHETMIIEKLKTELSILTNEPEQGIDMALEIGKLRDSI